MRRQDELRQMASIETDECILWPHGANTAGYPSVRVDGRSALGSRIVCAWYHGEPPTPLYHAAHSCRTPPCINPRHLRWATVQENIDDRTLHGTQNIGVANPMAKLTPDDVLEIRSKFREGARPVDIALEHGVDRSNVSLIVRYKTWMDIA